MPLFDNNSTPKGQTGVPTVNIDDFILVGNNETVDLLAGDDILVVTGSSNTITGGVGNDDLTDDGSGTGNTLNGGGGNDSIYGGTSSTLDGGTGRDLIFPSPNGEGGNTITGGTGRDMFFIATGEIPGLVDPANPGIPLTANTITDFNVNLDFLFLSLAPGLTSFDSSNLIITEAGGDTTISYDNDLTDTIAAKPIAILEGIAKDDLTAANVLVLVPNAQGQVTVPNLPNAAPEFDSNVDPEPDPDKFTFSTGNATVGTVIATDADQDELSYSITAGNDQDIFAIDANGKITIVKPELFVFDSTDPTKNLKTITIEVNDGALTDTATVDITRTEPLPFTLDVDGNGITNELTDALLIQQYITVRGSSGDELNDNLITGLVGVDNNGNPVATVAEINDAIRPLYNSLDVDGNTSINELTDALLIKQYITVRGSSGDELNDNLITGLVGVDNNGNPVATVAEINDAIRPLYG